MKTRDLAILLDMSPDAVNDLARKGLLKGFKSGNQWRFRRKDVERYLGKEQRKRGLGNRCSIRLSYGGSVSPSYARSPTR
jgi:excisionase family DNA binding protein